MYNSTASISSRSSESGSITYSRKLAYTNEGCGFAGVKQLFKSQILPCENLVAIKCFLFVDGILYSRYLDVETKRKSAISDINMSYQKLPFGSGDDPDKLFFLSLFLAVVKF